MNKKLKRIKKEIKGNVWLFWDRSTWLPKEVELFRGRKLNFQWHPKSRIAFICENPSEGKLPNNLLDFKIILNNNNLSGAFVTDLIKRRGKKPNIKKFWNSIDAKILKKEIDAIKPYFVIAVGNNVEKILRNPKYNLGRPVEKIRHYSRTREKNKEDLKRDIRRIADIYHNLSRQQRA